MKDERGKRCARADEPNPLDNRAARAADATIATFPQNLALIQLMVSEKMHFTDGRTTDAGATALSLLTQSSRAKNGLETW